MLPLLNRPEPQVFCWVSRSVLGRQRQVRQSKERERERGREVPSRLMGEGLPEGSLTVLGSSGNRVEFNGSASEATYCL